VMEGPSSFGSCSSISINLVVKTSAQVPRAPELKPSCSWQFSSFQLAANYTYGSSLLSVGNAIRHRLANLNSTLVLFPSNSWSSYNLTGKNLPPGDYKIQFRVVTWYGGLAEGNVSFTVAIADAPVVSAIRVPDTVYRNQVSRFYAAVAFSVCSESVTPTFLWIIRNWANQLIFTGTEKILTVPQSTLQFSVNNTHFVELLVNGAQRVYARFELVQLPPIALFLAVNRFQSASPVEVSAPACHSILTMALVSNRF